MPPRWYLAMTCSKLSSLYAVWFACTATGSGSRTEPPKQLTTKSWPTFSSSVILARVALTQLFSALELDAPCAGVGKESDPSNRTTPTNTALERRAIGANRSVPMANPRGVADPRTLTTGSARRAEKFPGTGKTPRRGRGGLSVTPTRLREEYGQFPTCGGTGQAKSGPFTQRRRRAGGHPGLDGAARRPRLSSPPPGEAGRCGVRPGPRRRARP